MSGHSKWATTKRKKAKTDVARAKAWNKLIKEISIAAKLGGGNPDANPRLRAAILKCKSQSLPTKNIESAIAKGTGANSGTEMTEPLYEGRGPAGIAIMVQCMTDNKVRTVAEIRNIFNKNNGSMGESGSVSWAFTYKGVIVVDAEKYPEDQVMDLVLEAGAEDMSTEDGVHEISTSPEAFDAVSKALEAANIEMMSAELSYVPNDPVKLGHDDAVKLLKLIDKFEDHDPITCNLKPFKADCLKSSRFFVIDLTSTKNLKGAFLKRCFEGACLYIKGKGEIHEYSKILAPVLLDCCITFLGELRYGFQSTISCSSSDES